MTDDELRKLCGLSHWNPRQRIVAREALGRLLAEKERLEALLREDRDFITSKGLFEEFWQFAADRAALEHGGE